MLECRMLLLYQYQCVSGEKKQKGLENQWIRYNADLTSLTRKMIG